MKRNITILFISLFFLLVGCSKNNNVVNPPSGSTGGITFKINHTTVPSGVTVITATLTRANFTTITKNLNLLSDSTGDVIIQAIQVGTWHLKIDAKDTSGTILYKGETDVTVQENVVVQLNLTLNPVSSGTGTIYIFVTWGTQNTSQWIDYGGNPVLTRVNNPSLPNCVRYGKVLADSGYYKMWYCAVYSGGVGNIWYAVSQNGINWNTIGSSPVLTPGTTGSWDEHFVVPSVVLKENNQYKMYYLGSTRDYGSLSVGLATSIDGIHWVKYSNPVITPNEQYYSIGLTDIVQNGNMYLAYFDYTTLNSTGGKIGLATSTDGLNWVMYSGNPILVSTLAWEGGSIHNPSVIFDNNQYKMVYGNAIGQNAFGMATSSDGFNFVKKEEPILRNRNTTNNLAQISYPFFRKFNNVSCIYYTGSTHSDGYICLVRNFDD
jgi:predicted GH43/DUF377 family glycosyl hydrolase